MARVTYGDRLNALLERPLSNRDRGFVESLQSHYERKGVLSRGRKHWLLTLEEQYSEAALAQAKEDPLADRLAATFLRCPAGSWDQGFVESLQGQVAKSYQLSSRQLEILAKIEARYSDEVVAEAQAWESTYLADSELQLRAKVVVGYYKGTPYFKQIVGKIASGAVPSKQDYDRFVENKFAQKVWAAWIAEAKYPVGSYVRLRDTAPGQTRRACGVKPCVVIETNAAPPKSAAVGAKVYKVLPFGGSAAVFVEERMLKKARGL